MKKIFSFGFILIFLTLIFSCGGGSSSHVTIKKPISMFYSNPYIQDMVEVASIDITGAKHVVPAINTQTMQPLKDSTGKIITYDLTSHLEIDKRVKEIGDYLVKKGYIIPTTPDLSVTFPDYSTFTMGVPIITTSTTKYYSYPSWFTKPTDYQGTRVIEIIDKPFQDEIVKLSEDVVYTLPLKILLFTESYMGKKYLHISIVDPVRYLKNFKDDVSSEVLTKLNIEKNKLINDIENSLKNDNSGKIAFFNIESSFHTNVDIPAVLKIATVDNISIDNFTENFLKSADIITTLNNGKKVRYIGHNPDDPSFPYNYIPDYLNENDTEVRGILSFCRFILPAKNIWLQYGADNNSINYVSMLMLMPQMSQSDFNPPKSAPMEFLIKNSLTHIYARYYPDNLTNEKYIKFSYKTADNRTIYQLSFFDPYIATSLMTLGQWHKPFQIINLFIKEEKDGSIGIYIKNPQYLIEKYFADVSDVAIKSYKNNWDSITTTMFHWPDITKEEMGELMLNKIKTLINRTLKFMGY